MLNTVKPDEATLKTALNNAELMIETGHDYHHVAQALLYLNEKNQLMSDMISAIERYLQCEKNTPATNELEEILQRFKTLETESLLMIETELSVD